MSKVKRCLPLLAVIALLLCGCGTDIPEITVNDYIVKFTVRAQGEYMLTGGDTGVTDGQMRLLLESVRSGYENALTSNIWSMEVKNIQFGEYVDNLVLNMASRLVLVNMLAEEKHIELSEQELSECHDNALAYYEEHADGLGYIKQDELLDLFVMMRLSDKVYDELTRDVNIQISMDEARIIKIQYIYADASNAVSSEKQIEKLENAQNEFAEGADFSALAGKYSDSTEYEAEIGRGELEESFETAAFNLDSGQISDVVSCDNGWYLIYCVDDNVAGKSESQAESLIQKRRNGKFEEYLGEFSRGKNLILDENKWEKLSSRE